MYQSTSELVSAGLALAKQYGDQFGYGGAVASAAQIKAVSDSLDEIRATALSTIETLLARGEAISPDEASRLVADAQQNAQAAFRSAFGVNPGAAPDAAFKAVADTLYGVQTATYTLNGSKLGPGALLPGNAQVSLANGQGGDPNTDRAQVVIGNAAGTKVTTGSGSDIVALTGGSNDVSTGAGNDLVIGGSGTDLVRFSGARSEYTVGQQGDTVVVIGPEGYDRLVGVEQMQFLDGSTLAVADVLAGEARHEIAVHDAATGESRTINLAPVALGSPAYLNWQYLHDTVNGVAIAAAAANCFIKGSSGNDAIQVTAGTNVLDGGTGSNFLVGGTGTDGGTDTFFTDARGSEAVWNTLVNFHKGDAATLWGFLPGTSTWKWEGVAGADGYAGATLRADVQGTGRYDASITFAGLSVEQASGLQVSAGVVDGKSYLYVHNSGV